MIGSKLYDSTPNIIFSITECNSMIHLKTTQPKGVESFLGFCPTYVEYNSKAQSSSVYFLPNYELWGGNCFFFILSHYDFPELSPFFILNGVNLR